MGFFIPHWGLPYAQSPNSKATGQLVAFPRKTFFSSKAIIIHIIPMHSDYEELPEVHKLLSLHKDYSFMTSLQWMSI